MGVTLVHRRYRPPADNAAWDHDHCEFCCAKLMVRGAPETVQQGYVTEDDYRWICVQCFEDFKGMFCWKVIEALTQQDGP
jgi:hypothetical protein